MKKIACNVCGRKFSMEAHLARHMNTIHSGGGKSNASAKPSGRAKKGRGGRGGRAASSATNSRLPIGDLVGDLMRYRDQLVQEQEQIGQSLTALDNAVALLGGAGRRASSARKAAPARKRGRRKNRGGRPKGIPGLAGPAAAARAVAKPASSEPGTRPGTLKDFIAKVVIGNNRPLAVKEIVTGVKRAGYKSTASNLANAVNNALSKMKSIKKVGRGVYTSA